MRRDSSAGALALLALCAAAVALPEEHSSRETVERFVKASNGHDAAAALALFDPEAAIWRLGEDRPAAAGHDAIGRLLADEVRDHPKITSKVLQWMELGPWVVVHARVILEPGEPARGRLFLFEVVGGAIRRRWTMESEAAGLEEGGGEAPVGLQIERWNERDLPRLVSTYDDAAAIFDLSRGQRMAGGEDGLRERFEKIFEESPRLRIEVTQRMALGPWVVYRQRAAPGSDGRPEDSIAVYEVRDGLIRRVWLLR